jgi:hypothetical protein
MSTKEKLIPSRDLVLWAGLVLSRLRRLFHVRQNLFGVDVGRYFFEDVLDFAVRADYERGASNAHHFLAIHILFLKNTEGDGDFFVGIGQQGERQGFFVSEFFLRRGLIRGYAKQHGAGLLNLFI